MENKDIKKIFEQQSEFYRQQANDAKKKAKIWLIVTIVFVVSLLATLITNI